MYGVWRAFVEHQKSSRCRLPDRKEPVGAEGGDAVPAAPDAGLVGLGEDEGSVEAVEARADGTLALPRIVLGGLAELSSAA